MKILNKPEDLDKYESKLVRVILASCRMITTSQLSKHTKFSWKICKRSLDNLYLNEIICKKDLKNRIYWYSHKHKERLEQRFN